ncbi:MAG: hypothetical protein KAG80_18455 [Nocardioides sp.]|nr:hypothetical protein [Nocardioides sp.]
MDEQAAGAREDLTRAGLTRRGALVLGGSVLATTAWSAGPVPSARATDPAVPTWDEVNGYPLGLRQATVAEVDAYVEAVAAASPRVTTEVLGHSREGRAIREVVVTSERNHRRLPALRRRGLALRDEPTTRARATRVARDLPAFVVVVANVHGNEPSGADALMQVLYDLAAGQDEQTLERLDELVVAMSPIQNPDGRDVLSRPNAMGFDLNRDWFAMTQPETPPRIELFRRYPAVAGLDLHEQFLQGPDAYFFPPNADPVHRESSRTGLWAANDVLSPAIADRFDTEGYPYSHYGIYDLFAPIYGDSVPNQAFGAAGFLMEVSFENAYSSKFDRVYAATDAALAAMTTHRRRLVTRWARQWPSAVAEGRRGELRGNLVQDPAAEAGALPAPSTRIYGYAMRTDRRSGDVGLLVQRLLDYGVQVHTTRRPIRARRLRRFGTRGFSSATLPAGSLVLTCAQPMKSWLHLMLEDEPHAPVDYYYDVSGWASGVLMRLEGGAVGSDEDWLDPDSGVLRRVRSVKDLQAKPRASSGGSGSAGESLAFRLDSAEAFAAAFALLGDGVEVRRLSRRARGLPAGSAVVPASARGRVLRQAWRRGVEVRSVREVAGTASYAVRRPRVALVRDLVSDTLEPVFARNSGYAEWLLSDRFGLDVTSLYATEIDAATLLLAGVTGEGYDAVVVPDGFSTVLPADYPNLNLSLPAAGMTPAGLLQLHAFVRGGGTFLGWGQQGITTATLAGLAPGLEMSVPLTGLDISGTPFAVDVAKGDPATRGLEGRTAAFNFRDPVLTGGTPLVTYPEKVRSYGYAGGTELLAGTVAVSGQPIGTGRAYVCSFDPAFRGWPDATQALVGSMLMTPSVGPDEATDVPLPSVGSLASGLLAASRAGRGTRPTVFRVAGADGATLRAVVAAADAPEDLVWDDSDGQLAVYAPATRGLAGHPPVWVRGVREGLDAAGVRPLTVIA